MTDNPLEDQLDKETRDLVRALFGPPHTGRGLFAASADTDTDPREK